MAKLTLIIPALYAARSGGRLSSPRWLPLALTLWLVSAWPGVRADPIVLVADSWCPYNCAPESDYPGFMVEIARRAFAAEGIEVQYRTLPWLRALQGARHGTYDGVIGASRIEAPEFVFPTLEQGKMRNALWVKAGNPWRFEAIASLGRMTLGVMGGYAYGPALEQFLNDQSNRDRITMLYGDKPLERGVNMLIRGRIDVLVEDEAVMLHALKQTGLQESIVLAGYIPITERYTNVYVAFSPAQQQSSDYAARLSRQMQAMRDSGELSTILARYNLRDWRSPPLDASP